MKTLIVSLLFLFSVSQTFALELVGGFVRPHSKQEKLLKNGSKIYFLFQLSDGRSVAYPVTFKNSKVKKKVMADLKSQYLIDAKALEKEILVGEMKNRVKVLQINSAKKLSLADLSPSKEKRDTPDLHQRLSAKKKVYRPGISGINDKVTNAAILGAGAALIASILMGK